MGYTYDINTAKKDNISGNCLFACHTIGTVISCFISTFLVAYIYQFSNGTFDYVYKVGIYNLCVYVTFLVSYPLFSFITDKTNRVWVYRAAQIIRLAFIISIIFYGKQLARLLPVAGLIYGLSEACYYASYNVLKQEMVSRTKMTRFAVLSSVAGKIMNIITPITLGALIQVSTYEQTSIYVAVILGIIVFLSFWIRARKPDGSSFSVKRYFAKLKENPQARQKIMFMYKTVLIYGFTTITATLVNVCIMLQFNSTLSLGSIASIIEIIGIVQLLLLVKFTKPGKRSWVYAICMFLPLISSLLFVIAPSKTTVIIYNVLMSLSSVLYGATLDIYRNATLKEAGLYSEIAEHQTVFECLLTVTRVISITILILVSLTQKLVLFYILLVVFSLSYSAINICMLIYEKKFCKPTIPPREIKKD